MKKYSYYYNEHKKQVEIYINDCLQCTISEVYNKEQAQKLFEEEMEL